MIGLLIDENLPAGLEQALGGKCIHASEIESQATNETLWH